MQDKKCVYSKCVGLFYAVNKENRVKGWII